MENSPTGTRITNISVDDPDAFQSQTFSFTLPSPEENNFPFYIDGDILRVNNSSPLNYERHTSIGTKIVVTDSGTPPLSFSDYVVIMVQNILENPTMAASSTMDVIEESSVGTIVGTIIASAESELKFQLDSGDTEYFGIHSCSGLLYVKKRLQMHSRIKQYTLVARATSEGYKQQDVTINVQMKNRPPITPSIPISVFVPEDSPRYHIAADLTSYVTDPNVGDKVFFSIVSGSGIGYFYVNTEGQLILGNTGLNYEVERLYSLRIRATDTGGLKDAFDVILHVVDRNDPPYALTHELSVVEDANLGSVVGEVKVHDEDGRNQSITYSILSGNTGGAFNVNSSSGIISIVDPSLLNFESSHNRFNLNIRVQDISSNFGGSTAVKSFTTAIIDGTLGGNWSMNGQPYIHQIENGGVTKLSNATAVSATVID